jgi:hypothetical protein
MSPSVRAIDRHVEALDSFVVNDDRTRGKAEGSPFLAQGLVELKGDPRGLQSRLETSYYLRMRLIVCNSKRHVKISRQLELIVR